MTNINIGMRNNITMNMHVRHKLKSRINLERKKKRKVCTKFRPDLRKKCYKTPNSTDHFQMRLVNKYKRISERCAENIFNSLITALSCSNSKSQK